MKILQIHKYFSRARGGGSVSAFFETKELLEKRGHSVAVFSMRDETNESSPYEKYFAEHFDINDAKTLGEKLRLVPKIIRNREAEKKLELLLRDYHPDVAHIHNIYHYLTPSIIPVLKKHRIPVVFKLSDYKIICPNYSLFTKGSPCERCRGGRYYNAVIHKCLKNSRAASAVAMAEAYYHHFKKTYDGVDRFTAPSEFMRDMCASFGIARGRISLLRNVLNFSRYEPMPTDGKNILYVGRLSPEKGIGVLLSAIKILREKNISARCVIAGKGPDEARLKKMASDLGINDAVRFVGFAARSSEGWSNLWRDARISILPSRGYDNSPVSVSESMAFGRPAVVSDSGGTKEMIEDGTSGLVFRSGDARDLAKKIEILLRLPKDEYEQMSMSAVARAKKINSEDTYCEELMKIYRGVLTKNQS